MLTVALLAITVQHNTWNPRYSEVFRANPTGPPNHVAVLSWFGSTKQPISDKSPGALMLDLYTWPGDGPKRLVTSTQVGDAVYVEEFSTHRFYRKEEFDEGGRRINDFGATFLAALVNGGQFSHLLVWWFDPHSQRPVQMLDAIMGDSSRLDKGVITENSPARYVYPDEWPKGVKSQSEIISREWTIGEGDEWKFVPGPWRLTKK